MQRHRKLTEMFHLGNLTAVQAWRTHPTVVLLWVRHLHVYVIKRCAKAFLLEIAHGVSQLAVWRQRMPYN